MSNLTSTKIRNRIRKILLSDHNICFESTLNLYESEKLVTEIELEILSMLTEQILELHVSYSSGE